jgi:hypothetical protein
MLLLRFAHQESMKLPSPIEDGIKAQERFQQSKQSGEASQWPRFANNERANGGSQQMGQDAGVARR